MKILKSNIKEIGDIEFYKLDNPDEIWQISKSLWMIDQDEHAIVLDLKLMQNLARTFDKTIKDEKK